MGRCDGDIGRPVVARRSRGGLLRVLFALMLVAGLAGTCLSGCSQESSSNDGGQTAASSVEVPDIDNAASYPNSPLFVDLGDAGYETMDIAMGSITWGVVSFDLYPTESAYTEYREGVPDASTYDMLLAWSNAATVAQIGDVELARRSYTEWTAEFAGEDSDIDNLRYFDIIAYDTYAKVMIPACFFDTSEDSIAAAKLSVESEGFDLVESDVVYRNCGASGLVIRVLDKPALSADYTVLYETTLSESDIRALGVIEGYETSANCGMAGIRSFYSEAVLLSDVLDAAGVNFASGMELQLRVSDASSTWVDEIGSDAAYYCGYGGNGTFDWDFLYGETRYNYPAMWDDETVYEELGGRTVYELLAADKDVWKDDSDLAAEIRRILGESKEEVEPVIALGRNQGVVAWGGTDPKGQTYGDYTFNPYSTHQYFGFLFGMLAAEDGSVLDDNTMFNQAGVVFGIDIIDPTGTAVKSD